MYSEMSLMQLTQNGQYMYMVNKSDAPSVCRLELS